MYTLHMKYTLHDNHWTDLTYHQRVTEEQWRQILLDHADSVIFRGSHVPLVVKKDLGYGVLEIGKYRPLSNMTKEEMDNE